ncbi:MAG: hypothetical protein LBB21_07260 [Holosporaceae bacterium]|jgi:hypothetical protein|nr:hypothetical protein [Holosporaceae bacterium]
MKRTLCVVALLGIQQVSVGYDSFDGIYFGGGVGGGLSKAEASVQSGSEKVSKSNNCFFCNLLFGKGKASNASKVFCAGEILADFSKTKHIGTYLGGKEVRLRNNGIVPYLGFLFGRVEPTSKTLTFVKFGITYTKLFLENEQENLTIARLAPTLGCGVQKNVCLGWSSRFEVCYRLKTKRSNSHYRLCNDNGFNARVTIIHNIIGI